MRKLAFLAVSLGSTACAANGAGLQDHAADVAVPPNASRWRMALATLAELRREATRDGTMRLGVAIREPFTGKVMRARGAVATDAERSALRMQLLGPGGTTALDLWIRDERFRFVVPAVGLQKRGEWTDPAQVRGLPVSFLRWWLLDPFAGRLLWTVPRSAGERLILRDDSGAIVEVDVYEDRIVARRSTFGIETDGQRRRLDEETVEAERGVEAGCSRVRYRQRSTGLRIDVTCEGIDDGKAPPAAFVDPDEGDDG